MRDRDIAEAKAIIEEQKAELEKVFNQVELVRRWCAECVKALVGSGVKLPDPPEGLDVDAVLSWEEPKFTGEVYREQG